MSSRRLFQKADRNRGRPSTASSSRRQDHAPVELPEYEPPLFPLDAEARKTLTDLSNNVESRKYSGMLAQSLKYLSASVSDINDRYGERKNGLKNIQAKRRKIDSVEKSEQELALERAVASLREVVPDLTTNSELAVREVIDWKGEQVDIKTAMEETKRKVELESAAAGQRQAGGEDDDDEMVPNEEVAIEGPLRLLSKEKEKLAHEYNARTLEEKYSYNNDYIQFKKLWHDAVHGSEGKPLQDASKWFNEGEDDGADDEDDDLIVAREVLDYRCPLSLQIFTEPYTSEVCHHTFEKASIYEYLNRYLNKTTTCPQSGCSKQISKTILFFDKLMARKIKRAQQALENENEDEDDDDDDDQDDEAEADGDASMTVTDERNIKSERGGRRRIEDIEDYDEDEA